MYQSIATITIDAYGAREQMELINNNGRHRHPDVVDQARHDGDVILSTLDDMKDGKGIIPEEVARRNGITAEAIDAVAKAMCEALVGTPVLSHVRKAYGLPSEPLRSPLPVDERARRIAICALLDLRSK